MRSPKSVAEPRGKSARSWIDGAGPFGPACLERVCTFDPWDRMSVGLAKSCPVSPKLAPTQGREVLSDLLAVQTPLQFARIRRVALAPIRWLGRPRSCPWVDASRARP